MITTAALIELAAEIVTLLKASAELVEALGKFWAVVAGNPGVPAAIEHIVQEAFADARRRNLS